MNKVVLFLIFTVFLLFGCVVDQGKVAIDIKRKINPTSNPSTLTSANISNVQIINNQLVITGSGLSGVTNVKVDGNSLNQNFAIETKSATQIIANAVSAFSFDVSKVFNLILSDAYGAATFPIDFSLCNATLNGKGFDCAAPVTDKDVLSYDQPSGKWIPRAVNGLSYRGAWDANNAQPGGALAGDYYIVSVANPPTYGVGDWIVWNGGSYEKINNTTTITSVFGRPGAIIATEGDYDLDKLLDVDLTVPATIGKVLKYDGMKWVAGDDLSGGGAGSITATEIAANAVTDVKIDSVSASKITGTLTSAQIADGTIVNADINAAAAIDYSKLNIPAGSIPYAKLNIANGDIPAAKISGLPSATVVLATTITDADTTHAPDGNAVYDALALKLGLAGGVLNIGATISGLPALPTVGSEAASKDYVDTKIPKSAIPTCGANEVLKSNGTAFSCVTDSTGEAAITAGTTAQYYRGDKTFVTLDSSVVPENTNLYFTVPRVRTSVLTGLNTGVAGPITATDDVLGAFGKLQYQVTDLKSNGQWIKTVNDIAYSAGNVQVDKKFLLKDSGSNFVEIKAPATVTSTYTLTLPTTDGNVDQVLRTDGAGVLSWVDASDASIQAFAKTALPTCAAGEVLKSNGTAFSCVPDVSGAGAFTGTINKAVATDGSGALISSATTAAELGYVAGVTSGIQAQLDAKQGTITVGTALQYYRGDKTFVTLDTAVVPENGNLYFTTARAKGATVADAIADAVIDVAPSQNAVFDALALKLSLAGGVLNVGATISGLPAVPTVGSEATSKDYVDTKIPKSAIPTCGANEVLKADGTSFTCVTDNAGAGAFSGTANKAVQTGVGGALEVSATTSTELGYVSGVTSSIQTQLNAKQGTITAGTTAQYYRGDKTFVTLDSSVVPENTNLYFTEPRVLATVLTSLNTGVAGPITAVDTVLGGFGKLQYQITDLKTFDTSVQAFAKTTLPTCGANEVLKSDGTSFTCVTDASGAGAFSGTINKAVATDGSGALISSATSATELGYVAGVTSSIQTQLDAKQGTITAGTAFQYYRGDKTFVTLDTAVVPENGNLYFTTARAKTATVADAIADAVVDVAPSQNAVYDALAGKLNTTGGNITPGYLTVPTPALAADAANKGYVDTQDALKVAKNGDTMSGLLTLDADAKLKGSSVANYVTLKANASTVTYSFTLPINGGTNGYVLSTDGSGGTSWIANGAAAFSGTANRAIASGAGGALEVSATTAAELGYVSGVTSSIQTQLNAKEAAITAGTTAQYIRGDKTLSTFASDVLATPLTGFSATNSAIVATDTVLQAFNKAQGQIAANTSGFTNYVDKRAGATESVLGTVTFSGTGVLRSLDPIGLTDVANRQWVESYVTGNGVWAKSGSNISYSTGAVGIGSSTIATSALVDLTSTTKGFAPPRMTKAQRDAIATPATGLMVFNTTDATLDYYNGTSWLGLSGAPKYIKIGMSALQSVNNGSIVAFDTVKASSGMMRSGTGIALKAGVTYRIEGGLSTVSSTDTHYVGYILNNGTSDIGQISYTFDGDEQTWGFKAPLIEIYKPTVDEVISVRIVDDHIGTGTISYDYGTHLMATELSGSSPIPGSDNLGNHIATQNLNMGTNFISHDGNNKGLKLSNSGITSQSAPGTAAYIFMQNSDYVSGSAGSGAYLGTTAASGNTNVMLQAFKTGNTVAASMYLQPFGGSVSINKNSAPSYELDVYGGARINSIVGGELNGSGNFHLDARATGGTYLNWSAGTGGAYVGNGGGGFGPISASAFAVNSDRRLKKDIRRIEHALDSVMKMNGVRFNWISEKESKDRQVGVIAQEIQSVYPELVSTSRQTKKLTVNYSGLVAPLIEAIKELYHKWFDDSSEIHRKIASVKTESEAKIRNLEAENTSLKVENAAIKARLDKIEKALQAK